VPHIKSNGLLIDGPLTSILYAQCHIQRARGLPIYGPFTSNTFYSQS
jgi:hypothetical protein